ncbi:MAG: Cof-type HAD-IIB family hydrolase [Oscillospiraceae bacterium]|nr:Cof-type HAD-IIB family hydrolase [Oscillospiraceae bacterium]
MGPKILFLDLDGTLLNDRKEITPGNRRALDEALARGHRIVVTSGRPLKSSLAQARRLGLAGEGCCVIAYNGGAVYDCTKERTVHRETLEPDVLYRIYDEAARRGIYIQTYDREDVVIEPRCDEGNTARYCAAIGLAWRRIGDVRRDLSEMPVKALLIDYQDREPLEEMKRWMDAELAGRADCFFSSRHFLEAVPAGVNKGSAVEALCQRLGIDMGDAVAVGDESNDVSMIRAAGVGAAMANAIPEAKAAADYVTERDNNHDGVEGIIRRFLL